MATSAKLLLAQDESTPEAVLHQIWNDSRSATVRKAVARNPNAGPEVLKAASRLYLEEVLENPGFAVLELFDEDPWIHDLSVAYANPDEWLSTGSPTSMIQSASILYIGRVENTLTAALWWACLLSPKLTSNALNTVIECLSLTPLRRALSSVKVQSRVKILYEDSLASDDTWPFDLGTSLILYTEKVISAEQLYSALSNHGIYSTSTRKSTFVKFFKEVAEQYTETKESFYAKILAKLFLIVRNHALNWVSMSFHTAWSYSNRGELFTHVLSHMITLSTKKELGKGCFKTIGEFVSEHMDAKFFRAEDGEYVCTPERLAQAYHFIVAHNLTQVFSGEWDLLEAQESSTIEALAQCTMEIKEFFVKKRCVGNWVVVSEGDAKYQLFESINDAVFATSGVSESLLFNKCSLKKIISISDTTYCIF
jgi:hypothetical protein